MHSSTRMDAFEDYIETGVDKVSHSRPTSQAFKSKVSKS